MANHYTSSPPSREEFVFAQCLFVSFSVMSLHMRMQQRVQSTFMLWIQVDQACVCANWLCKCLDSVLLKGEPAESRAKDPRLINPVQSKFELQRTNVRGL